MRIEIETSGSEVDAYIHPGEERTSAAELDDLLADVFAIVASLEDDEVISPIPLTCPASIGPNIPDAPTEDVFDDMMSRAGESEEGDSEVQDDQSNLLPIADAMSTFFFRASLHQLAEIDLEVEFQKRAHVFKGVLGYARSYSYGISLGFRKYRTRREY